MPQQNLNLIYGSISSYCSIINSHGWIHMINQEKQLSFVLFDIQSGRLGEREDGNNRALEADYQNRNNCKQKQISDDYERLKFIKTCEVLVRSVFAFFMDHINNLLSLWVRKVEGELK